jgi:hypothetical protein
MSDPEASIADDAVYARLPDIVVRRIAGDAILVPVRGELARMERIFVLDEVGEHIWAALDGRQTAREVLASVVRSFEVDEETARADLAEFVAELADAGLITASPRRA